MMTNISVLIPAYNEGSHISSTLCSLQSSRMIDEIIVVDDGSDDDTAIKAKEGGARVIRLAKNKGKGGAVTTAYPYIRGSVILILDADLKDSAEKALVLVEPILAGEADLTIARFPLGKGGCGFGTAKKTARLGIKLLTGKEMISPLSGQRCMRKEVLRTFLPLAPGFGMEVGMIIDALKQGYRVLELETYLEHCPPGRNLNGFLHRGRQFMDICTVLGSRVRRLSR